MIGFSLGRIGLSPANYVEVKKNPFFSTLGAQEQRILLLKSGEADQFLDLNEDKIDPRFIEEKKLVRQIPLYSLVFKDLKKALELVPEIQFTQLVWLGESEPDLATLHKFLSTRSDTDEIDGHLFVAKSGPLSAIKKLSLDQQSYHISIMPTFSSDKKDEPLWALVLATVNADLAIAPQKPYTQVVLPGLPVPTFPPKLQERDDLLKSGVSTIRMNGKQIILDRLVTTQTKNDDPCFRDVNTKQILSYLRYDLKQYFSTIFSRMSLARDDFAYSGDVITPKAAKALVISRFRKWQEKSLVQDPDGQFAKDVQVEVDSNNPGKLNFYLPIVVMGQLYTTQTQICFSL